MVMIMSRDASQPEKMSVQKAQSDQSRPIRRLHEHILGP